MGIDMFKTSAIFVLLLLHPSCIRYIPRPIDPAALDQSYRARNLSDPGLEAFFHTNSTVKPPAWPPQSLDLEGLTLLALYFSPDLDEARARIVAADAAVGAAGTKPNPTVGGGGGYTDAEASPYAFRFEVSIPFETAGKRQYRIQRAQQLSAAARFSLAEVAWGVRSRLRRSLADHLISNLDLGQRTAESQVREEIVAIYEKRLDVGEVATPIVSAARTDLARVQIEIEELRGRIAETRAGIAGAIGLPSPALDQVQFALTGLENPPAEEALNIASVQKLGLMNRLDVQRLLSEYAAAESELQLQVARQYPDISLGPSYSFGEGANSYTIGPGLTLPFFDRNAGRIAEADARRAIAGVRFLGTQASAIDEMERALADYRSALRELEQAERTQDLIRGREQATQRQLAAGEADRLALTVVRLESATARRLELNALRRAHMALGALEDAVQRPLAGSPEIPTLPERNPREKENSSR